MGAVSNSYQRREEKLVAACQQALVLIERMTYGPPVTVDNKYMNETKEMLKRVINGNGG